MNLPATLSAIASLSVDERLRLIDAIWDTISSEPGQPELTQEQADELDRRLAAHLDTPDRVVPWEQVKAQALRRAGR